MTLAPINISSVPLSQLNELVSISRNTFFETFASENTEEDMRNYLENNLGEAQLGKELADPSSQFFFAVAGNEICGYFKVNYDAAHTVNDQQGSLELERIYVLKKFQSTGVGRLMLDEVIKITKQHNLNYLWLGVWEQNPKAIRFYERNGFVIFGKHIFRLGNDDQTDLLMRLDL